MYTNPRTLFQQQVSSILKKEDCDFSFFENIFKLHQLSLSSKPSAASKKITSTDGNWKVLLSFLNELGPEKFVRLISLAKGMTVIFPSEEDMKDSILTTLCYYYKEVEGKTWEDIKSILNMEDLNTIKFGIRVRQLQQFIQSQILKEMKVENE